MIHQNAYPILEFDDNPDALINPGDRVGESDRLPCERLIISFFGEAIRTLLEEGKIEPCRTLRGENEVTIYRFLSDGTLLMHGMIGCPATAGFLDRLTGLGVKKVLFCGGGGALEKGIHVGQLFVVEGAIRDEGFSYHYVAPSRVIYAQSDVRRRIGAHLREKGIAYTEGLCWTTDCMLRETRDLIRYRNEEGAKIVEMEQAGCIAVAQFRGIAYGAILYGGDDVSGLAWDRRKGESRQGVRYALIELCREIIASL